MARKRAQDTQPRVSKRLKLEEDNGIITPEPSNEVAATGDGVSDFEILTKYRDLYSNIGKDRVEITRNGDFSLVKERLEAVDQLFGELDKAGSNKNSLIEQDARTVLGVSELAELSVRNMKLDNSEVAVNRHDILRYAKRFMLQDYFRRNDVEEGPQTAFMNTRSDHGSSEGVGSGLAQHRNEREVLQQLDRYDQFAQFNWFKVGMLYQTKSKAPVVVDHLLGPFAAEKRRPNVTHGSRAVENPTGEVATAQKVSKESLSATQEKTTPGQVKKCYKTLVRRKGYDQIGLFDFIIDPHSFPRTVEHLFYTSFLIKEGKIMLEEDAEGFPAIRAVNEASEGPDDERHTLGDGRQNHLIFQMDMSTWRALIRKYNIQESFIP
ncbi:LAME_0E04874g1_1 [Lachancea meyersii CBS 8951]|uniref:Non-structural maintenance of chromosomes element 4 n=1 Tax=Lachancea meyersii CBS 8951 TaxID=1266667 RepID=A0A1G4JH86_9SACH|nr:LAME_0E04874g1_1 [Lachancea meyersii CBS 8951]